MDDEIRVGDGVTSVPFISPFAVRLINVLTQVLMIRSSVVKVLDKECFY